MEPRTPIPTQAVAAFCRKWGVREFALFGSILRDDFGPGSDVDVLVTFSEGVHHGLEEWIAMEAELGEMFAHEIDLVERRRIVNPFRRHEILTSRRVLYAA